MQRVFSGRACGLVAAGVLAAACGICRAQDTAADTLLRDAVADRQGHVSPAEKAMQLYEAGRYEDAIVWFDRALQDEPLNEQLVAARLIARREVGVLSEDEERLLALVNEQRAVEVELIVRAVHLRSLQAEAMLIQGRNADALAVVDELIEKVNRLPKGVNRDGLLGGLRELADRATGRHSARDRLHTPRRYVPGRGGPSVAESVARDAERLIEEGDVRRGYKSDEARTLVEAGRSRRIPAGLLTYPANWPEITERRKEYADGTIYKGKPFRDADGQMRYTAVYDLRELMMQVPDFTDAPETDLEVVIRNLGDRYWLQQRSEIYGGYADDLAAGVPLLNFFGGVDESSIPPSPYAADQRYQEIMGIIREVLGTGSDAAAANN